jgi:uncharacterized repeat protein (TIGR04138 family)
MTLSVSQKEAIEKAAEARGRFSPEAYVFTYEALGYTLERRAKEGRRGHVTGRELLDGILAFGRRSFGYLGKAVFESWGLKTSSDFGDVVFDLVDAEVLAKQDSDEKSDFDGGFEFAEAFEKSFIHD